MRLPILLPLFLLSSAGLFSQASKPEVLARIDAGRAPYEDIALKIWDYAEVGYRELRSSALLQERLATRWGEELAQRVVTSLARDGWIDDAAYDGFLREEISRVIALQDELGLDVLVHGEPERNDMVQYFAEHFDGFATTANGWVQSYGSRCVKPLNSSASRQADSSRRPSITTRCVRRRIVPDRAGDMLPVVETTWAARRAAVHGSARTARTA